MFGIILGTLPMSVAAAISATSFVIFFAVLAGTSHQVARGLAFIIGGLLANALIALVVVLFVGGSPAAKGNAHSVPHAIADFAIAALAVVIMAVKAARATRPKPAKAPGKAGNVMAYAGYGAALRAASANCMPPYLAAVHGATTAQGVSAAGLLGACLAINVITLSPLILALVMFLLFRQKALAMLSPVSSFLDRNKDRIFNITLAIVAAYLVFKGVGHLRAPAG